MATPKETFIKGPHREAHEKWSITQAAEAARDAALLQFIHEQPAALDPAKGWDSHSQLVGARRILEILFALSLKDETRKFDRFKNLQPPS